MKDPLEFGSSSSRNLHFLCVSGHCYWSETAAPPLPVDCTGRRGGLGSAIVATVHWGSQSVNMGRWTLHNILFLVLLCKSNGQFDRVRGYVSVYILQVQVISLKFCLLMKLCLFTAPPGVTGMCVSAEIICAVTIFSLWQLKLLFLNLLPRFATVGRYWDLHE